MNEKEFFLPGDVVILRQNIPNKPVMIVVKKTIVTLRTQDSKTSIFQGILCRWFSTTGMLQEATFNTKDIQKIN